MLKSKDSLLTRLEEAQQLIVFRKTEKQKAMTELNGVMADGRPIKLSEARPKTERSNNNGGGGRW